MTGKRFTITAVVLFALGIPASGADQTVPFDLRVGQSVHVVAVRTSSRLESVIRDRFYSTVTYVACGKDIGFDDVRAAGVPVLQPATLERLAVGQTPIISTDPLLRSEIEKAFTKKKKLKVAATPSGADLVLVAFGEYPIARLVIQGTKLVSAWRGYEDSSYSFETATVLAFLLPADVYRQTGTSTRQLSDAALWQGYTWIMNTGCNRSAQADAARELVGRFHEALRVWIKPKNQSEVLPRAAQSDPSKVGQGPPQLKTTPDTPAVPPLPWTSAKDAAIKVATNLVIVPVAVSDRAGGHVPDLTQGDFRIFEDDAEQKIDHFRTVETPFRVVLLLDSSASMRLKNEELSHAATAFVDQLQAQDRVMVVPFDSEVRLHSEFTNNRALLHEAISRIRTNLGTRLYDAVDLILTERLRQVDGRKAIVLFTDGVDTESRLTDMQRTIELAQESGALIYSIFYDTADDVAERPLRTKVRGSVIDVRTNQPNIANAGVEAYRSARQYVRELSEATGAREYQADSVDDLSLAFSQIAAELGRQYEIAYYPSNPVQSGSYRRIVVQVNRPDVTVRARPGYRSP